MKEVSMVEYLGHTIVVSKLHNNTYEAVIITPNGDFCKVNSFNKDNQKLVVWPNSIYKEECILIAKDIIYSGSYDKS